MEQAQIFHLNFPNSIQTNKFHGIIASDFSSSTLLKHVEVLGLINLSEGEK